MVLILDLIVIVFVVIISFCLCINNNNSKNTNVSYSCQFTHILVGLSVIVFYKLVRYIRLGDKLKTNKEMFEGDPVTQSLNDFISGSNLGLLTTTQASTLSPTDFATYTAKLDTIIDNINALQQKMNAPSTSVVANPANAQSMDLDSQQKYQMFQIDYLSKQIKNTQDILNAQSISNTKQNYKPIKVFSSCMVANANGTTTSDIPVSRSDDKPLSSSFQNVGSNNDINNMLNTISQSNDYTNGQGTNLSSTTGIFNKFLSGIQKNGTLNINM